MYSVTCGNCGTVRPSSASSRDLAGREVCPLCLEASASEILELELERSLEVDRVFAELATVTLNLEELELESSDLEAEAEQLLAAAEVAGRRARLASAIRDTCERQDWRVLEDGSRIGRWGGNA